MLNKNYEKFPNNFFPPREITVDSKKYKYYLVRFNNLYDIYNYLKSNPYINKAVFSHLSSRLGATSFSGMPYSDSVDDLINFKDQYYFDFVDLVKDIANAKSGSVHKFQTVYSVAGGRVYTPNYSVGSPYCYETEERIKRPKFINVYSALSYSGSTSKYQVFNRAVVLISIISALEKQGYNINLNAFEMSSSGDEIVNNVVDIKKHSEPTNLQALYKTSCKIEFLRRILFGVLETVGVENVKWGDGYGKTCPKDFVREVLNIGKDDIYFGTPQELGVGGASIKKDFEECLDRLNLSSNIDIKEIDDEFDKHVKKLIR